MLIPLLRHLCKQGLDAGRDPIEILDAFFSRHTDIKTEEKKIDFMFQVIRRFYASLGKTIAHHAIELTVQGQTITSMYGSKAHFIRHCEQLLTAGLSSSLLEQENTISDDSRQLIEKLAQLSGEKYAALKNHDLFIAYPENKSTLYCYCRINIGSRPHKRGDKDILDFSDLRAIPFVGSWSQLKQNVPGY